MKARQARRRFFGMAALAAAVGASFFLLSYAPQRDALRAKEAEAVALRREIGKVTAFRRAHPDAAQEAKSAAERKRLVDRMVPARLDAGAFLAETEKRASESGIALLGVVPGETETAGGFVSEKLRLSVRGDYFALLDFLYALEQQGRFVRVDAARGKADGGVFTGSLEIRIYAREK